MATSSTIKDSYAMEAWSNFYTVEVWKGFLRCGSVVVLSWLAALSTIKDSYALEVEKFLHRGSLEGSTELVGRIRYHKRIPTPSVWKVVSSWLGVASTINWLCQVP